MTEGFVNSWLQGPFAPVDQEVTAYDLKVTGTIPRELEDGRLLRVGPNPGSTGRSVSSAGRSAPSRSFGTCQSPGSGTRSPRSPTGTRRFMGSPTG